MSEQALTHFYCQAHYDEFSKCWDGDPSRAYPGEKIAIDPSRCEHWDCVTKKRTFCPHCGAPVKANELIAR